MTTPACWRCRKKLAAAGKEGTKKRADRLHGEGEASPTSGLDLLKRTLKEVVGVGSGIEEEEEEQAVGHLKRAKSMPADVIREREQNRATSSFVSSSRYSLGKLDIVNRFRAPPIGSYRPKEHKLSTRTRQPCHIFAEKDRTKSLKTIAIQKEIERLQEEGEPYDHLVKIGVAIELKEGIPDNPLRKPHVRNHQFHKDLDRPDLLKAHNLKFNDNSFTAVVLDGNLKTSQFQRQPTFDFAKVSTAPQKER